MTTYRIRLAMSVMNDVFRCRESEICVKNVLLKFLRLLYTVEFQRFFFTFLFCALVELKRNVKRDYINNKMKKL